MKRALALLLVLLLAFGLSGCRKEDKMYIQKAELTEAEEKLAKLLGAGPDSQLIYDFRADEKLRSIAVNCYELIDGEWQMNIGGGLAFDGSEGRIALRFDDLSGGMRVAIQCGEDFNASDYANEPQNGGMSRATSAISDRAQLEYGKEIPLVVQIATMKTEIRSFVPEYFFTPEEYAGYDYEHVYVITVMFDTEGP